MDQIALKLEQIYTTIDWPFRNASMTVSLFQSGKSRADLWQLAALVALERTTERANRACDLDYHARQQVTTERIALKNVYMGTKHCPGTGDPAGEPGEVRDQADQTPQVPGGPAGLPIRGSPGQGLRHHQA